MKGRKVEIRGIREEDLPLLLDMINDPVINNMTVGESKKVSMQEQEAWFERYLQSGANNRFIIENKDDGAVGTIIITDIDEVNRSCGLAIKLSEGRISSPGVGIDAFMVMLRYCFEDLKMHRVTANAIDYNKASLNLQSRCGMKREGVLRQAAFKNGEFHDVIITSMLDTEYRQFIEIEKYWD